MNRYLGPNSNRAIVEVRSREPEWFALADNVAEYAGELISHLQIPHGSQILLLVAVLCRRVAGAFEAVIVLSERGMSTEGMASRRSLMEALFVLGAIVNKPELVDVYLKNDEHRRRGIYKNIQKLNPEIRNSLAPELTAEAIDKALIDLELAAKAVKYMSPKKYAEAAGLEDQYLTDYAFLSEAAHHVAKDLERNIAVNQEGDVDGMYWGPEPDLPSVLLVPAIEHMLMAASATETIFNMGPSPRFTALWREAEEMSERLPR